MKSTLITLIVALVRQLIGSDLWTEITRSVSQAEDIDSSGSEKRDAVQYAVREYATTVAGWLINLAIEAAVARLRATK